jgi:hypothetical protein
MFFHRFKQGALRFGCGTVDLIGKDELGKQGAWMEMEALIFTVEHTIADNVSREQIAGELDALVLQAEQAR